MQDLNFTYTVLNHVKTSLHCNLGGKAIVDKVSCMLGVDSEIVQEIANMPITHELLSEATFDIPEPTKDPILCDSNRAKFFENLSAINKTL